jgi:hypothetical protein
VFFLNNKEAEMDKSSVSVFLIFFLTTIVVVLAFFSKKLEKIVTYLRIKSSARRLQLRDRGDVEAEEDPEKEATVYMVHALCKTRIRVGIHGEYGAVHYCWKCELISTNNTQPGPGEDPDGGEPVPEEQSTAKVIPFNKKVA